MPELSTKPGTQWGRWTIREESDKSLRLTCECGTERTIRKGFFTCGRMSYLCRRCLEEREKSRLTRMFAK